MGQAAGRVKHTLEEYLALEAEAQERSEYVNGEIYAVSGGTQRHAQLSSNAFGALLGALRGKPCRPLVGDQRIRVPATGSSLYPDVAVVCGKNQRAQDDPQAIVNPTLIVEVLSPSTADYDQGSKFHHYRRLPSLQEYLLISQDQQHVEHRLRTDDGRWQMTFLTEGPVELPTLGVSLRFEDLYADLDLLDEE
ncbi:MAG: Uma2 family endonuclease [Myxococcales bacterium]|nr:Uma2 family endonuclease [Myxococcales bacterium]